MFEALFGPPSFSLRGRLCLLTGAASGIGREMAMQLCAKGCKLALWDLDIKQLQETAAMVREIGTEVEVYQIDLTKREDIYAKAKEVQAKQGHPDVLINNAGIVAGGAFLSSTDERNELTMKVNTLAHFWTVKAFLPHMLQQGSGHIVAVSSMAGHQGLPGQVDYAASKFATRGFMEALAAEIRATQEQQIAAGKLKKGSRGVRTSCVCPGPVQTPLFKGFGEESIPVRMTLISPSTVAQAAIEAIEKGREMVLPGFPAGLIFRSMVMAKGFLMAAGGYGDVPDPTGHDAMATVDMTQANRLFGMMSTDEVEAVGVPVPLKSKL